MSSNAALSQDQHQKTCVLASTRILGDKWTPILLFALADGSKRFCELQQDAGGINPRTLSARLDGLEEAGIIARKVYPEVPPKVEYTLSTKGKDLLPVITSMIRWAEKYAM